MGQKYASAKHTIAECDRCGFQYKLHDLKNLYIKTLENTLDLSMPGKPNEHMFDDVKRCNSINDDIK